MKWLRSSAKVISGRILPRLPYPVLTGPLKGSRIILGALEGAGGGATVYFNMMEPMQTAYFSRMVKEGQVVFDVGANVGYYTILGAKLVGMQGKVFAFEPLARNIAYLHRHVSLNRLSNVSIIPCACSDKIEVAAFYPEENAAVGHLESTSDKPFTAGSKITLVPTLTLDAVSNKLSVWPDILKIDVEGAELSVLKGAKNILSNYKPTIFLSVHSEALRNVCLAYLTTFNYEFTPLLDDAQHAMEFLCISAKNSD